jgi:hypothetical protein
MTLEEDLTAARAAASRFAGEGEEVEGVVPTEPTSDERVYLCTFANGEGRTWLALDASGEPVGDRRLVREAASIAVLCELAEESAAGGDVGELRARLVELRLAEDPVGIEEAEQAAAQLADTLRSPPRVASAAYLDAVGLAAQKLETALGSADESPFATAMRSGIVVADELATDVVRAHKLPLE